MKKTFILIAGFFLVVVFAEAQKIAAGDEHSLVICNDSSVWGWGNDQFGQIGNLTSNNTIPAPVNLLSQIIAVSAGRRFSLALKNDGTVWAWGINTSGQLGLGYHDVGAHPIPVQINSLNGIIAIEAGADHSLALKNDSTVWAWGFNAYGELGNGTRDTAFCCCQCESTPTQVLNLSGVSAIAAGTTHSHALKNDGTVWSWGDNVYGVLGDSDAVGPTAIPVQVYNISNVVDIASGQYHALALKNDGTVWGWGNNQSGQLGDNTTLVRIVPVQTHLPAGVKKIANTHGSHSLFIDSNEVVLSCGSNVYGQLGDGTTTMDSLPALVDTLTGIIAISGGFGHSLAYKSDASVWSWGRNYFGQLGDSTTIDRYSPVIAHNPCGFTTIVNNNFSKEDVFIFYPNPTTSTLTLSTNTTNPLSTITIYSTDGRKLREEHFSSKSEKVQIDLSGLAAGVYFLECVGQEGRERVKVVKY